ncbi:MAG: AraC family transcriptional regulator [Bacteroidales bacterium]|nr:AraC family transcriptional regulator [Bacteroidales bacterium]
MTPIPNPLPHWHPDADFANVSFFIRRMNTSGFIKPDKVPRAVLPGLCFIYLTGGEILVEVDSRPYLCSAGHLLLIPDKLPFAVLHYSDAVGFTGLVSPHFLARSGGGVLSLLMAPHQQAFWFDEAGFVGELFNMLQLSFERGDTSFIEKGVDILLSRIKPLGKSVLPAQVQAFFELVFSPGAIDGSLKFYAGSLGISTNYLSRLVRQTTGRSPGDWIDIARIGRAKELLSGSQDPVIDIAASIGLEDQSYFSRFFRRHTGMTPSEYRKRMQG